MIPDWMKNNDSFEPPSGGGFFAIKTIRALAAAVARIKLQNGRESRRTLPAFLKLLLVIMSVIVISASHSGLVLLLISAVFLLYLCTYPAEELMQIILPGLLAATIGSLILLPAALMDKYIVLNIVFVVTKIFLSVIILAVFNRTTQWNHITAALKRLKVPRVVIFIIDITLKYIVMSGVYLSEMLNALLKRKVGDASSEQKLAGSILGSVFLKGVQLNEELYEAMVCRGFTDDY